MNKLIKLENAGILILCFMINLELGYAWWIFLLFFLVPDLSMIGYSVNTKLGALLYNLVHHQGLAILIGLAGYYLSIRPLLFAGLILLAHSALDRVFGYGLKYSDDFKHTHLGWIGKQNNA
ncbi:MAG: DUF4260 domain-containing protein [Bacteroidetes bacterium]|nr:DUF4260 domain-containing protein [Bacteroidota bacterium]